ncbi:MAG: alpha/beta fold hydrolase [Myxococcota bacterium]
MLNLARRAKRGLPQVGLTPADVVHRENKWSLLRYRARPDGLAPGKPIVLVPSLINRHYVLDLMPQKSFVEYLVDQGRDVYIIDWGTPTDEDRYVTFDDVADRILRRAFRVAAKRSGSSSVHVLGYCLGGTLTAIHAAVRPERIATLTVLAAPVDFHDDGPLSKWTNTKSFDLDALVSATGLVPWPLMQAAFYMLRPTMMLSKAATLVDRAWNDEFLDGFLAIERWGNDNVSFPGACYERYIQRLYRDNALIHDAFTLSGHRVKLSNVRCPVHAVTFGHDNIVPWKSAAKLVDCVGTDDTKHLHLPGGHVGAVVSKKAKKTLWPELLAWWQERDDAVVLRSVPSEASG